MINSSIDRFDRSDHKTDSLDQAATLHRYASFVCSLIMCACCAVGIYGNSISLLIFTRRSMRSPINVLLAGLSLVDLFVVIFAIPVFVTPGIGVFYFHSGSVDISDDPEREAAYFRFVERLYSMIVFGIYQLNMIAQTCSIWTCVFICSERYLAVCKPFVAQRYSTVKRARIVQLSIFAAAIGYNLIRFFEYEPDAKSGSFKRRLRDNPYYIYIYYTVLYLLTHFLVPFFIITVTNVLILRAMRRANNLRRLMTHKGGNPRDTSVISNRSSSIRNRNSGSRQSGDRESRNSNDRRSSAMQQRQTSRVIVVVTIMFALCNTLSFVISIWEAFQLDLFIGKAAAVAYLLLDLSNVLVVFNSASTFVFYLRYCTKYRRLFSFYCSNLSSRSNCCGTRLQQENGEVSNGFSHVRTSEAGPISRRSTKLEVIETQNSNNTKRTYTSRTASCDERIFSRALFYLQQSSLR